LFRQPDEQTFRAADVTKPVYVPEIHHFTYKLCSHCPQPGKRLIDVFHGEHNGLSPSSVKKAIVSSIDSTTMPTLFIRINLLSDMGLFLGSVKVFLNVEFLFV
jgi:hypothetical protein